MSLPLSTKEGFVLSRIDGASTVEDIAMMVGVKVTDLLTTLDRLADLGAVKLAWRASAPTPVAKPMPMSMSSKGATSKGPPPKAATDQGASSLKGVDHPAVQRALALPAVPLYTEAEVNEHGDLSEVQKRRVLNAFYALEGRNYYQMLGLDPNADKKAVRAAYFELSRLFHPDSLFGKDLGPFKAKMESVFKRLTEAYEVLSRGQRRKEYDEYLASTVSTHAVQHTLDRVDSEVRALSAPIVVTPAAAPPTGSVRASTPTASGPTAHSSAKPPRSDGPDPRQSQVQVRSVSPEERRAQARERLRRSFVGPTETGSIATRATEPPPGTANERRDSALKGLKESLRQGVTPGGVDGVLAHLRRAREAEQRGDMLAAAAALQAALALQPNHKDIQAQYERVSRTVARELADNYQKQALYEEKQSKWGAAAASWERVLEGRPEDANAARAAATALLRASGDLTKARQLAQRAVDAAPRDCANVVVLARVLLASGQRSNARRELEKAVKLDPRNEMIKNLLLEAR